MLTSDNEGVPIMTKEFLKKWQDGEFVSTKQKEALDHAQHILESAGLTTEGFDQRDESDGAYRVCISNQLNETGEVPPFTNPKILTIEIYDGLFERIVGLPIGYGTEVKQVGNE